MSITYRLIVLLAICAIGLQAKDVVGCGTKVDADLKLEADIGPCTGDGLILNTPNTDVTIDLNGHEILGQGIGKGVAILQYYDDHTVILKGPGRITNFQIGVDIHSDSSTLVYGLRLQHNSMGIMIWRTYKEVRVHSNTIIAGKNGSVGIGVGGTAYVYQNTISGHSDSGVRLYEGSSTVAANVITENRLGVFGVNGTYVCTALRGNRITDNLSDGIQLGPMAPMLTLFVPTCFQFEDNIVASNKGSGIAVLGGGYNHALIQDNIVERNQIDGITLKGSGFLQVFGNRVQRNGGIDLFWDPVLSPDTCGRLNVFDTQSQPTLPQCPTQ